MNTIPCIVNADSQEYVKEAVWMLTNVLGTSDAMTDLAVSCCPRILPFIIVAITSDYFDCQREATFAIQNAYR